MKNKSKNQALLPMSLGALGVIYGDIGTSPLYAIRESLGSLPINLIDVLGLLSLILWSLLLVISIKYMCIVLQADNKGEGGILALLTMMKDKKGNTIRFFFIMSLFGAGLLLGDGMLTPAISVLSAIEGMNVIVPTLSSWVVPIVCFILLMLFAFQHIGTARIGFTFGPIIFIWFCTLAALGASQILQNPVVLKAVNPYYAYEYIHTNGWKGYVLLGGVFLVVTGCESIYADLGHFRKKPIQLSWFFLVLPALIVNYFGQGAYLLQHPSGVVNPFYSLAPVWFEIPLLILATVATIIASQAVISATFSLTKQAVLLGLYPRLPIKQTSKAVQGQVYVPQMNFILACGVLLLVIVFKNSSAIAHAYGIAVNSMMLLTTIMVMYIAYRQWQWHILKITVIFTTFLCIELGFLGANIQKIITGGWIPIVFALFCAFIIFTWNKGMDYLRATFYTQKEDFTNIIKELQGDMNQLPDVTFVFISDVYDSSGGGFLRFLKLNRAIPERVLVVNYQVDDVPYVSHYDRYQLSCLDKNICQLTLRYGFMDFISIPKALKTAVNNNVFPFVIDLEKVTYLIEAPNIINSEEKKTLWFNWQERVFSFLMRNYSANINIEFYHLPYDRTIAIGSYCVI